MPQQRKVQFLYNSLYKFKLNPDQYLPAAFIRSPEMLYRMTVGFIGYLSRPAFNMTIEGMDMTLAPKSNLYSQFTRLTNEGLTKTYDWDIVTVDGREMIRGMVINNYISIDVDCDDDITIDYLETEAYKTLEEKVLYNIIYYAESVMEYINELPSETLDFKFECVDMRPNYLIPILNEPEYREANKLIAENLKLIEILGYNSNPSFVNGEYNLSDFKYGSTKIKPFLDQLKISIIQEGEEDDELSSPQSEIIRYLNSNNTKDNLNALLETLTDLIMGDGNDVEEEDGQVAAAAGKRKTRGKKRKTSKKTNKRSILKNIIKSTNKPNDKLVRADTKKLKKIHKKISKCVFIKNKKGEYKCKKPKH